MEENLGRLIRTLNEKCSECAHPMQLRGRKIIQIVRGLEEETEEEYKICSFCSLEVEIPLRDRKKRVERPDKTRYVKEVIEEKRRYPKNAPDNKRVRTPKNNGTSGKRGI